MQSSSKRSPGRSRQGAGAVASGENVVRRGTRAAREVAAEAVADVTQKVRTRAERLLAEQKHRAASELQEVGKSIRGVAGQLQAGPLGAVGEYVEAAAEGVTRASRYLEEQDLGALVKDAEDAVRRVPQWFLPAMFVAGLALARFAKATENQPPAGNAGGGRQARPARRQPQRRR